MLGSLLRDFNVLVFKIHEEAITTVIHCKVEKLTFLRPHDASMDMVRFPPKQEPLC